MITPWGIERPMTKDESEAWDETTRVIIQRVDDELYEMWHARMLMPSIELAESVG